MSLIKSAFLAASFAVIGTVSAATAQTYDSSRIESMRTYEWSPRNSEWSSRNFVSVEARRARAQAVTPSRQPAPFSRAVLESQTW